MTVGESNDYLGYSEIENWGELSTSATFNYPPWSPPHKNHFDPDYEFTVEDLFLDDSGNLNLTVDGSGNAPGTNVGEITLWIRNSKFPLANFGANGTGQYGFRASSLPSGPDLDWEEGDTVRVVLTYTRLLPSAPENVRVTAPRGEDGTLEVRWDAADAGTFPIECYLVEFRHPSGDINKRKQSYPGSRGTGKGCGDSPPTSVKRTDLEPEVGYEVLVQALSGDGYGEWSAVKTVTTRGETTRSSALSVADAEATEGEDATLDFTVSLDGNPGSDVTVDYETRDGTAAAGSDYTEKTGTLTFALGDTEKTVSVPITDDAVEDDGETFTLVLSNASGATIADAKATGTIRNSETAPPLTAEFRDMPASHDGETAFTFRVAFSEPLSWMNGRRLREDVVAVAGGRATKAGRVNRRRDLWQLTVEPDSLADVTVTLAAGAACGTPAAVCTKDGRALSHSLSATVEGPASSSASSDAAGDADDPELSHERALALAAGVPVEAAAAVLLGEGELDEARLAALDRLGNRNGRYDLGDLLAWRHLCGRGAADCGVGPSSPVGDPAAPPGKGRSGSGGTRNRGVPGGGGSGGRRGSKARTGRSVRTRRRGFAAWGAALVVALAASACGMGDGIVRPPDEEARVSEAAAGPLAVRFSVPAGSRAIGAVLRIDGPAIESVRAQGLEVVQAAQPSPTSRLVIVAGPISGAAVVEILTPPGADATLYRVELLQVAGEDYALDDPEDYRAALGR
ncbi:Calx-beta domain-containing protein [Candidatus Palauibacter sp.]|uniref:Calx-beta domain-containing protein n=1 Tax=Candidatus Palauibacter sp. TaxID=3101350 RepID=UPI003B5CC0EC